MRKTMLAIALFALLPATAFAGPDRPARPAAQPAQPAQIATLGGDFPTSLTDEDLVVATNAGGNASYAQNDSQSEPSREQSREGNNTDRQREATPYPNGQPKYVHIYWFIGGH